jgi:hypothetical protein
MVEGFSMGGSGAAKWGFKHFDLFGSISIIDGALHSSDDATGGKMGDSFKTIYAGDRECFAANDPWKLASMNSFVNTEMAAGVSARLVLLSRGQSRIGRTKFESGARQAKPRGPCIPVELALSSRRQNGVQGPEIPLSQNGMGMTPPANLPRPDSRTFSETGARPGSCDGCAARWLRLYWPAWSSWSRRSGSSRGR